MKNKPPKFKNPEHIKRFGEHFRTLRLDGKLTQDKAAGTSAFDQPHMSDIECGKRNLGLDNIFEAAREIKKHPRDLFDFPIDDLEKNKSSNNSINISGHKKIQSPVSDSNLLIKNSNLPA